MQKENEELKLAKENDRGVRAEILLKDELLQDAFTTIKENYNQSLYSQTNFSNNCINKLRDFSREYKCKFKGEITLERYNHFGRNEIQTLEIGDNLIYYREQNKPSSCVIVGFLNYRSNWDEYCDFEN